MSDSLAKQIAKLPVEQQREWLENLDPTLRREIAKGPWWFVGRPEQQIPPGEAWTIWLTMTGRGWGKSRTGAETLAQWVLESPTDIQGAPTEWLIIGETFSDARKVCVEGPSGFLRALDRRGVEYQYNKSDFFIRLESGPIIHMKGAENADVARGFNLAGIWADELAKWPHASDLWKESLRLTLRAVLPNGRKPRAIVTTTPKPAHPLLKEFLASERVTVTTGALDDNRDNLPAEIIKEIHDEYDGTRLGRQEVLGELIEDVAGALWNYEMLKLWTGPMPEFLRIVVAVDPAVTNTKDSDETGIVVAGKTVEGYLVVIADYTMKAGPTEWARRAVAAFQDHKADRIVVEDNQGGDAWQEIIHGIDPYVPVDGVRAYVGKRLRAEPIAALYEQGLVYHLKHFEQMEGQMTMWEPYDPKSKSPDRVDALVHALTELTDTATRSRFMAELMDFCPVCTQANPKGQSVCQYCGQRMVA